VTVIVCALPSEPVIVPVKGKVSKLVLH
jgi:hypothetical protein